MSDDLHETQKLQAEVERLKAQVDSFRGVLTSILTLASELKPGTIDATRAQLLTDLEGGAGVMNYVGHGGIDRLSAQGMLVAGDAPPRLRVFLALDASLRAPARGDRVDRDAPRLCQLAGAVPLLQFLPGEHTSRISPTARSTEARR